MIAEIVPRPNAAAGVLPFLSGERVNLRPLSREDLNETYLGWLNDPEVTRFLEVGRFPSTREELEDFYHSVTGSHDKVLLAIVDRETGLHIGNIKLDPILWVHRRATLGIMIGDKRFWGSGICTEASRLVIQYAFQQLNLHRIDLGVYADHAATIRAYEKVGFRVEGRLRQGLYREGTYWDSLWMGLLRDDFVPHGLSAADQAEGTFMEKTKRTVAIIQARMNSTRLPAKVMADIAGKPMLLRVIERVRQSHLVDDVVVATTDAPSDDCIAGLCAAHQVCCYRGSEQDVLDRYYRAAQACAADVIVRITSDCPLIDPGIIDSFVSRFRESSCDYVAAGAERTYPDGLDTEVFSFAALERAWSEARWASEREHVTPYIWKNPQLFRAVAVKNSEDLSALRWSVDQQQDLDCVRAIYERLGDIPFGWRDVLELVRREPALAAFNSGIAFNEGYAVSLAQDHPVELAKGGNQ